MSSRNRTTQPGPDHTAADSEALAAYVLNALEPERQLAMRQHLQDCDICYLEYTSLGVLPGLLDSLSFEDIRELTAVGFEPPAAATGPERAARPERGARAERSGRSWSRRRRALLAGGAFSAAMVATGFAPAYADTAAPTVQPGETAKPASDAIGVSAQEARDAQNAVVLTVSAEPLPEDQTALDVEVRSPRALRECVLEVTTDDGARIEACHWSGTPSTRVVFNGDIPLAAARLRAVAVLSADGTVLARQDLGAGRS